MNRERTLRERSYLNEPITLDCSKSGDIYIRTPDMLPNLDEALPFYSVRSVGEAERLCTALCKRHFGGSGWKYPDFDGKQSSLERLAQIFEAERKRQYSTTTA